MIRHTKRRYLIIVVLFISFISCKKEITKNNTVEKSTKKINIQGFWNCTKTEKDKRFTTKFGDLYTQEFQLYSKFRIKNDSIYMYPSDHPHIF